MRRLELEVTQRTITGGLIPANIFGHGIDSLAVQVDSRKLQHVLARAGGTDLISLKVGDSATPTRVLIRKIQRNPMTGDPIHVDFYQVRMTEKLKAEVPLLFIGEAPALIIKTLSLLHTLTSLHIEALPDDLPHNIEVDISSLAEADQAIHVKDIKVGKKITVLSDPDTMVIKVAIIRKQVEEVAEVKAAEEEAAEAAAEGGEESEKEEKEEEEK
ncbi:MAG: 50S ribosomal protein L25 [Chloroflexi bacterium]|nr:50S ribosomal protein L25 [Chloroflexota bacterium]